MAEEGPGGRGKAKPKRGHGSYEGEVSEHPGNKAGQGFEAGPPNFPWPAGVTQFSIPAGKALPLAGARLPRRRHRGPDDLDVAGRRDGQLHARGRARHDHGP